jgi:hypothetical protein
MEAEVLYVSRLHSRLRINNATRAIANQITAHVKATLISTAAFRALKPLIYSSATDVSPPKCGERSIIR